MSTTNLANVEASADSANEIVMGDTSHATTTTTQRAGENRFATELNELGALFDVSFSIFDATTGDTIVAAEDGTPNYWHDRQEVCRQLSDRRRCEIIEDESPIVLLAVPLPVSAATASEFPAAACESPVAIASFLTSMPNVADELEAAAAVLGWNADDAFRWAQLQSPRAVKRLISTGQLLVQHWWSQCENLRLRDELEDVSTNLLTVYEEISLLHRLTKNLKLSSSDAQLSQIALEWLAEVVPAKSLAIWFPEATADRQIQPGSSTKPILVTRGPNVLRDTEYEAFFDRFHGDALIQPVIRNHPLESESDWPYDDVRQFVTVPLAEGENVFGWLLAANHRQRQEFGTVEASLLYTVATILGIHSGNRNLYRKQEQFFAEMVRALTSAIDTKDPYTLGHSDRVARLSVRLGKEMGCNEDQLNTLYLSGLLHDIGKIGVDDAVLRKPGDLTDEEYEHIKIHPELGFKILRDLTQLDDVLPVVLHHHEAWDGSGYPHGLAGEDTPLLARIAAVADAYDAMSSDRPYRPGMPAEKLDEILRAGAGSQWDAKVVDCFFAIRDEMHEILHADSTSVNATLDPRR